MNETGTAVNNATTLDVAAIRAQFPILQQQVNGRPLVYLDNGATGQKPFQVIDAIANYYATINSNVHRGIHTLSNLATEAQERTRRVVREHINARHDHEVIFTSGTTASINLVADCLGHLLLEEGDE